VIHVLYVPLATQAPEKVLCRFRFLSSITEVLWDGEGRHLYIGENSGLVTVVLEVNGGDIDPRTGAFVLNKNSPKPVSRDVYRAESAVVQLATSNELLLVSSHARSVLVNLKQNYAVLKIGSKDRQGPFGACFDPRTNGSQVLCALPREKVWVADAGGNVLTTFKLQTTDCSNFDPYATKLKQKAKLVPNLSQLIPFHRGLVSWGPGQALMLVDTENIEVVEWFGAEAFPFIHCVAAAASELYVMSADSEATVEALNIFVVRAVPPTALFAHVMRQLRSSKMETKEEDVLQHIATCSLRASQCYDDDKLCAEITSASTALSEALRADITEMRTGTATDWSPSTAQAIQHFSALLLHVPDRSKPWAPPPSTSAPPSPVITPTPHSDVEPRKLLSSSPPSSSPLTARPAARPNSSIAQRVGNLAERSLRGKDESGAGLAKAVAVLKSFTTNDKPDPRHTVVFSAKINCRCTSKSCGCFQEAFRMCQYFPDHG